MCIDSYKVLTVRFQWEFLMSTKYWAGQYWFNIRFLLQFGCDSSSNTKARLEDIRVTLDCVGELYLYIMWEACSWDTDTAYWFPIQFDTREPISISSKEGWLRAFNYKEWHNAIVSLWFWYLNWTRNWPKTWTQCLVLVCRRVLEGWSGVSLECLL